MKALEPTVFTLTQDTWVKGLDANPARKTLYVENETSGNNIRMSLPDANNPFAYSFATNASVSLDPILSSPNTFNAMTKGKIRAKIYIDSSTSGVRTIFSASDNSSTDYIYFFLDTNDKLKAECKVGNTVQWTLVLDSALNEAQWYRVELYHDGVAPVLRVNGDTPAQTFSTDTDKTAFVADVHSSSTLVNAVLGATEFGSLSDYFEGDIDYFDIIDLSDEREKQISCQYRIDEGTGTTLTDRSSNGDNGTISNGAWAARTTGIQLTGLETKRYFTKHDDGPEMQRAVWLWTDESTSPTVTFYETEFADHGQRRV